MLSIIQGTEKKSNTTHLREIINLSQQVTEHGIDVVHLKIEEEN